MEETLIGLSMFPKVSMLVRSDNKRSFLYIAIYESLQKHALIRVISVILASPLVTIDNTHYRWFGDNALYKSTFYLLTYLLTY